jgi:hypothetical protein
MKKRKSHKRTSKARPARTREHTTAEQAWSPVEKALKFADKFQTFHQTPNNDNDRDDRPWEAALNAANGAAYAVIVEPATCLHDMEIKIQAWAFTSDIETGNHLTDLAAGRYRTTIAPSRVSVTEQTNKGANTIQGLPVRSHSPPLMVGMMTAQV